MKIYGYICRNNSDIIYRIIIHIILFVFIRGVNYFYENGRN